MLAGERHLTLWMNENFAVCVVSRSSPRGNTHIRDVMEKSQSLQSPQSPRISCKLIALELETHARGTREVSVCFIYWSYIVDVTGTRLWERASWSRSSIPGNHNHYRNRERDRRMNNFQMAGIIWMHNQHEIWIHAEEPRSDVCLYCLGSLLIVVSIWEQRWIWIFYYE